MGNDISVNTYCHYSSKALINSSERSEESLGYKNTKDALTRHVDKEDKLGSGFTTSGQYRGMRHHHHMNYRGGLTLTVLQSYSYFFLISRAERGFQEDVSNMPTGDDVAKCDTITT